MNEIMCEFMVNVLFYIDVKFIMVDDFWEFL